MPAIVVGPWPDESRAGFAPHPDLEEDLGTWTGPRAAMPSRPRQEIRVAVRAASGIDGDRSVDRET